MWIDTASRIESTAERKEFINGVLGNQGPNLASYALAGVLAWSIFRVRK